MASLGDIFSKIIIETKKTTGKKIQKEHILIGNLPKLSAQIIELVREHGRITIAEIVNTTGSNRNTVKDHLKELVKKGYIILHGSGRGAWYSLV